MGQRAPWRRWYPDSGIGNRYLGNRGRSRKYIANEKDEESKGRKSSICGEDCVLV